MEAYLDGTPRVRPVVTSVEDMGTDVRVVRPNEDATSVGSAPMKTDPIMVDWGNDTDRPIAVTKVETRRRISRPLNYQSSSRPFAPYKCSKMVRGNEDFKYLDTPEKSFKKEALSRLVPIPDTERDLIPTQR